MQQTWFKLLLTAHWKTKQDSQKNLSSLHPCSVPYRPILLLPKQSISTLSIRYSYQNLFILDFYLSANGFSVKHHDSCNIAELDTRL